jgi:misacylated tRNA(Ala) deacylase
LTEFLFRQNSYLQSTTALVTGITEAGGIKLDQTVLYAASGGQPGDVGTLELEGGTQIKIVDTIHPDGNKSEVVHVLEPGAALPRVDDEVVVRVDWDRRYRLMRMHTALHLLSVVLPFPVTGGSIGQDKGRLDFDMPKAPQNLEELQVRLNAMVEEAHPVTEEWITDAQMQANPELIKTMNVKPPMGQGRVRLIRIGDIDLQPCGGTHVRNTSEIGKLAIGKIEKKGKQNRRVNLVFAD